jgi:hypothetical protein
MKSTARHASSGYAKSSYAESSYAESRYPERGYAERGYAERGYAERGYAESSYAESSYAESSYAESSFAQGSYTQRMYAMSSSAMCSDVAAYAAAGRERDGTYAATISAERIHNDQATTYTAFYPAGSYGTPSAYQYPASATDFYMDRHAEMPLPFYSNDIYRHGFCDSSHRERFCDSSHRERLLDRYPDRLLDRYPDRSRDRYPDRSRDRYPDRSRDRYPDRSRDRYPDRGKNRFLESYSAGSPEVLVSRTTQNYGESSQDACDELNTDEFPQNNLLDMLKDNSEKSLYDNMQENVENDSFDHLQGMDIDNYDIAADRNMSSGALKSGFNNCPVRNSSPENIFSDVSSPENTFSEKENIFSDPCFWDFDNSITDQGSIKQSDTQEQSAGFQITFTKSGCKKYQYPVEPGPETVGKWNNTKTGKVYDKQKKKRLSANKSRIQSKQATEELNLNKVVVAARKGQPQRVLTESSVHSVLHLRQCDAARRLGVSQSVLKKTWKMFAGTKWPRHFPENILSDPIVKTHSETPTEMHDV